MVDDIVVIKVKKLKAEEIWQIKIFSEEIFEIFQIGLDVKC